jgi:hypothetical protein
LPVPLETERRKEMVEMGTNSMSQIVAALDGMKNG